MTGTEATPRVGDDEDQPARTRNRLLDAAIHIASTRGLDKVTYRSVGAQAGLSHSLVRFYFGSGDVMLAQALARAAQLDVVQARMRVEDLNSFSSELLRVVSGEESRGLLQYDYLLCAVRGGVPVEQVVALYDFYIKQVAGTLDKMQIKDVDGSIAALVFATLDGLVLQHSVYGSAERVEGVLARLPDILRLLQERGEACA